MLRLAQRAIKHTKFIFSSPTVAPEESKESDDAGNIEGGDEGVEEELENKEIAEEDMGDVERPKQKTKAEDAEEE